MEEFDTESYSRAEFPIAWKTDFGKWRTEKNQLAARNTDAGVSVPEFSRPRA
jgi:hypothetical protein